MDVAFCARVTPGGRQLVIERTLGTCTEALHHLVVRGGTGLGSKAMVLRKPVAVDDYGKARSISHHYDQPVALEGLHAIMAVTNIRTRLAERHRVANVQSGLSEREYEALCHAALGLGNAEIAERMGLVPGTVKAYLRSVMRKLGCHNRIAAVNAARSLGYDL